MDELHSVSSFRQYNNAAPNHDGFFSVQYQYKANFKLT